MGCPVTLNSIQNLQLSVYQRPDLSTLVEMTDSARQAHQASLAFLHAFTRLLFRASTAGLAVVSATVAEGAELDPVVTHHQVELDVERRVVSPPVGKERARAASPSAIAVMMSAAFAHVLMIAGG